MFSKQILSLLFISQVEEIEYISPLLSLLGISIFLSSMITVTNAILQAYKQVGKPIISMICGVLVKFVFAFILIGIPSINIYGAPISTFFSTVVIVAINLYFIVKCSGKINSVSKLFIKPFISAFLAIVIGIGLFSIFNKFVNSRATIILVIGIVALIYLVCIIKLKIIDKEEILMIPYGELLIKILTKIHLL